MELAPNPHYSGGNKSSKRFIYISYARAKTCKGDDSTAQGNTKGWGHTNKLKFDCIHKTIKTSACEDIDRYAYT